MQNRRVAARAVIVLDGKLLCVKLKKYAGKATGNDNRVYWCTPGGGVDVGEPLIPALEREVIEELGIKPKVGNLLYIQQFAHNNMEQLELFFHVTNPEDFLTIDLEKTTHGAIEIAEVAFIDPGASGLLLPVFLGKQDITTDIAAGTAQVFNNFSE
jgi:ADP-ribose pyrophosphatase YjhB (NUDIX family)